MSQKLENRVSEIEEEIRRIKAQLAARKSKSNWITETKGSFRGNSDYVEIARLGKEIRDAEGPESDFADTEE